MYGWSITNRGCRSAEHVRDGPLLSSLFILYVWQGLEEGSYSFSD